MQVFLNFIFLVFAAVFYLTSYSVAYSAPIPMTSSSYVISQKKGLFRSPLGFSLNLADTDWVQTQAPANNKYVETVYRSSKDENIQAALTVRVDKIKNTPDLSTYAKTWIKDYPRFGFEILSAKKVRVGENIGFLLDLRNSDHSKQLRQILFVKSSHAVTLTCRDDLKSFNSTLKSCNSIIRSFTW